MFRIVAASAIAAVVVAGCAGGGRTYGGGGYGGGGGYAYDPCAGTEAAGTVVGGAAGGIIGNQFGSGSGKAAATVGGVILGAIAGNAIARDSCRNERADAYYYDDTYYDAFNEPDYGRRYEWRNPHTGHYGYVTPRRGYRDRGRECREFTQDIYIDGYRSGDARGVACRQPDGSWRIVG